VAGRAAAALLTAALLAALPAAAQSPPARGANAGPQLPPRPDWRVPPPVPGRQIGPSLWRLPPAPRVRATPEAIAAARRHLCPNGGTPLPGGRCRPGTGTAALPGGDSEVAGWHRDLPPATRAQRPCPEGTRAVAARDQPGVTRCVAD
jgi:hypothetical protein